MGIKKKLLLLLTKLPMSGYSRGRLYQKMGVQIKRSSANSSINNPRLFVGEGCVIDHLHPELIEIGEETTLATGCVILTHYIDTNRPAPGFKFQTGKVKIGYACFIGANSIISKSVTIGDNVIVAAGSVVTKDIPANEIWGGNPAKFIKQRPTN